VVLDTKNKIFFLDSGKLKDKSSKLDLPEGWLGKEGEYWIDIEYPNIEELRNLLLPLDLHPLQLARCLDSVSDPGVVSFGNSVLMDYPATLDPIPTHLTILLKGPVLVTVRHGPIPALDDLIQELTTDNALPLLHLPQIIYLILDHFADLNVDAQIAIRDKILNLAKIMTYKANTVSAADLSQLRLQVENLVSLIEDQLYCISGLNASDNEALKDPHRKAYLQDLVSETEIAQRGIYRLETRLSDLYNDYQVAGNDRVEKRLRLLTIVSAITLPLGLIAGLLGMNVGGVPGTTISSGFFIVMVLMIVIALIEFWYFKSKGWFN
jgi:Mg2+ and Co2+ transporter CorA